MANIHIITYGCTANQDDSSILEGLIKKHHKITNQQKADIIIINTCVVKHPTINKVITKIKQLYKLKKIIIAGCLPLSQEQFCKKNFPKAALINSYNTKKINRIIKDILKNKPSHLLTKPKISKLSLPKSEYRSIQISQGCNFNCSFCLTKVAKPLLISEKPSSIIKEIKSYIKKGAKRINLTATDLGCYGLDIKTNLPSLLKQLINIKGQFKIRLGMMNLFYTKLYLKDLLEIYKSPKIIKFLHMPVQSGSNKILKNMNRNYSIKDFKDIINKFRKEIPNITISTDIIVGYPTETEKDFQQTLKLIKQTKPEVLNISKFSSMPNTKASKLKQLSSEIIKERSKQLTELYKTSLK